MATVNMISPWMAFYKQINALFEKDPEVHVIFDEEKYTINLYVDDACKAAALDRLLVKEKEFGNIVVKVNVLPANIEDFAGFRSERYTMSNASWFDMAFEYNPIYAFAIGVDSPLAPKFTFVVFKREVLQYYSDNLWDYYGVTSMLAQDIAREVFDSSIGVSFSTLVGEEEALKKSWP